MRAEVKMGVAVSAALVGVVGGYYFFFRGSGETEPVNPAISDGTTGKATEKTSPGGKPTATDPKQNPRTKPVSAQTAGTEREKQAAREKLADAAKGNATNPTPAGLPSNTGQSILKNGANGTDPRTNANRPVNGTPTQPAQDARIANANVPNADRTAGGNSLNPADSVIGGDETRRTTGAFPPATDTKTVTPGAANPADSPNVVPGGLPGSGQNDIRLNPGTSDPTATRTGNPATTPTAPNDTRGNSAQVPPSTPATRIGGSPTSLNPQVSKSDGVTNPAGMNPQGGAQPKSSLASNRVGGDATKLPVTSTPDNQANKGATTANPMTSKTSGKESVETHRVQPGDTLASISQNYYGSEKHAKFLASSNPDVKEASRLAVGTVIRIPPLPEESTSGKTVAGRSSETGKGSGSSRTYKVKAGDTFYSIAKAELGESSRWKDLFALNKNSVNGDATQLRIGQILKLPEK